MYRTRQCLRVLLASGLATLFTLSAQTPTAQVTGRVTDASGAVVPSVEVVITNTGTGLIRKTETNDSGYYTLAILPPGEYRLAVSKEGFRASSRTGITLLVDQVARIDVQLEVGNVSDSVEVRAEAPTVESGNAALGTVVSSSQIRNLPLNSRNPLRFVYLVPGFTPSPNFSDQFNRASSFRINGGRSNMNDVFIDGVSNSPPASNSFLSYAVFPSPDAIQEFKVQTNAYAAEYGRTGGGVINMVMRSGTNQFQGVVYEFLRNSKLDSNNFFANRSGAKLPSFKRSQFGFAGGGPIVRDKAFFFVNYEGLRQGTAATLAGTMPTSRQLAGDFSQSTQLVGAQCLPVMLYDPMSTRPAPTGSGSVRDPLPGNVVPSNRINPVASKVSAFFPQANLPGAACSGVNNFFSSGTAKFNVNQVDTKVDYAPTASDRLFAGLSYRKSTQTSANQYQNIAYTDFQSAGFKIPSWSARLDYTRIQRANLIFNVRAGFSTVSQDSPPVVPDGFTFSSLGFPSSLESQVLHPLAFPSFTFDGYNGLGQNYASPLETFQTYSLAASATWIAGRHSLKFGLDQRLNHIGSSLKLYTSGLYQFSRGFTQGPNPNVAAGNLGNSIASFLLGAGGGYVANLPSIYTSNLYTGLYVQDDFKATSRLTLNFGLRYEIETGKKDRFGQLAWFDYDAPSPLAGPSGLAGLKGGVRAQGSTANSQYPTSWKNIGPRFGFAYSINPKTVLRGGYGIFYLPYIGQAAGNATGTEGFSTQTAWVGSIDGLTPTNLLSNPYPTGLLQPSGSSLGLLTNVGQAMTTAIDRGSIHSSYVQQWNFHLQHELPGRIVIEPAYVGNKGSRLVDGGWEMNQLTTDNLSLGSSLQQLVANPFFGLIKNGALASAQVARGQLLRPFPQYTSVTNYRPTSASSSYHAFQMRVQREFGKSASFLMSYTAGKLIDDSEGVGTGGVDSGHQDAYYRRAERAVSPQDVSQFLVLSGLYELPFGSKKAVGSGWPGWLNQVAGNWQINGIFTVGTGVPLALTAANTSGLYSALERPNVVGDAALSGSRSTSEKLQRWFNTAAFAQPAPFTLGNAPRTLPNVRAPGTKGVDFSLFKNFPFGERRYVEFRAEFFNLTNTPNFGLPGVAANVGTFGVISTQANSPRQIQFGLKIYF
ncbi:MAG: TonB-dependent receptor [Acidobacteriota bacterium]